MQELKGLLATTYQKRQSLNTSYSRNAFARDLGISPTALSQFLSGKRTLSPKNIRQIADALNLPANSLRVTKSNLIHQQALQVEMDTFSLIAEWHHFGILNLCETDTVKSAAQVASRLGISIEQAEKAMARLQKLEFLKKEKGRFIRLQKTLDTGTEIPSQALRRHNREKLELAIAALNKVDITERDMSSLTLTFDMNSMAQIKKEIQKFKKRIASICESETPSEVYSLNVQFFPLTHKESKK